MIRLDFGNLRAVEGSHGLSEGEIQGENGKISDFLKAIKGRGQGFYSVIDDEEVVAEVMKFANGGRKKFKNIVVLGIGGSALGTICLQQSLKHLYENELAKSDYPKLHVLDNVDPSLIQAIEEVIDLKKTLFVVVTKSGGTPETLSQYFYFRNRCDEARLSAAEHFVFVTDPEKGLLRKIAVKEGIPAFDVPPNVGGRFSVLTAVGLLPAALIGIDIDGLLKGARMMRDHFLNESSEDNLPFQLAVAQYLLGEKGKVMQVMIPYSQRLIRFADWYRQLLAESVGKAENEKGEKINVGLTPINALGVTDQHSQSQLYNEGPNDKFFMFIEVENPGAKIVIPNLYPDEESVSFIKDVDFGKLLNTEKEATAQSLTKNDRPNMTIKIDEVNTENLGGLFMLYEGATAFLGEFYGINAFNQPGVELSKVLTKELLN